MHPHTAWVEIDLTRLSSNFGIINADKPDGLRILCVVKDQAYGHGATEVAKAALEGGCVYLAVATIGEAVELRDAGITAPVMVFGERTAQEFEACIEYDLTCFVNDKKTAAHFSKMATHAGKRIRVHLEVDSGLSRYGVRWTEAAEIIRFLAGCDGLVFEGIMSHFAMSDELDKTFANQQLSRFKEVLAWMESEGIRVRYRHMCNSGGFLDLPHAHFDMVRVGILPLGVYPSQVCRRIAGLQPVMSVKCRIATVRNLHVGDLVGYGMRYQAQTPRRIAVLPIGYGDGYPRVRNQGEVLIHGKRAPIIGGNAMDAMMVDITDIAEAALWDEVVLMGRQGEDEIDPHELAKLKGTVSYEVMTAWRWRLPREFTTAKSP
jgi:alanine racemase